MKRMFAGMTAGALALFVSAFVFSGSANAEHRNAASKLETVKQNYLAHLRAENLKNGSHEVSKSGPSSSWLKKVSAHDVNMVTNTNSSDCRDIKLSGKTYHVPESHEAAFLKNTSLRYTTDPLTGNRVDKADAVIFADASGRAWYFESEATYREFISLEGKESAKAF